MGEETEHEASREEYAVVGCAGTMLYSLLSLFVLRVMRASQSRNSKTIAFFKVMFAMCVCEIPRFFCIAVTRKYDWRSLYIFHIISGGLFFVAFSIVCLQWSSLLKLGSYVKALFSVNVIIAINVLFMMFDFVAIVMCAKEPSLVDFFESSFFYVYIFADALKNICFSLLLAFYGIRLIMKFYRYSTIELNERDDLDISNHRQSVFSTALSRLTITLTIASLCFVTRLIMLILKSIALNSDDTITSERFPLFGFYWFCFSDFIPRVVPAFTFVLLMRTKRRGIKRELDSSLSKGIFLLRNSARFTYTGDEEDYDEDEYDRDDGSDYFSDDDDAESVSLFDTPPGSFIDDVHYSSPLAGILAGHSTSAAGGGNGGDSNSRDISNDSTNIIGSNESRVDDNRGSASSYSSVTGRLSEEDVAKERRRHEHNAANEVSLTSFKSLSSGGGTY